MIRREDYGDDGLEGVVEIERSDGSVLYRELEPDGTTLLEREATPEEVHELKAHEQATDRQRATEAVPNVLDRILATPSPIASELVTLLVAAGAISVEDAIEAGWEPPA